MNYKIDSQAVTSLRSIDMIFEPMSSLSAVIVVIAFVLVMIFFFVLAAFAFAGVLPGKEITGAVLMFAGFLVLIFLLVSLRSVPPGALGIDQNGNWYKQGGYLLPPDITIVPLKGSIALSRNEDLVYDLSQEEVILLASGSNFPEYLRKKIGIEYDKGNVSLKNVPAGVNSSHSLKLLISF